MANFPTLVPPNFCTVHGESAEAPLISPFTDGGGESERDICRRGEREQRREAIGGAHKMLDDDMPNVLRFLMKIGSN